MFEETCGGPLGAYPASREYDDFIAYRRRLNPVVSHVHCGYSRFLLNHLQLVPKSFPEWRVQGAEGLIEEENPWVVGERPREGHPLLLPAAKLILIPLHHWSHVEHTDVLFHP